MTLRFTSKTSGAYRQTKPTERKMHAFLRNTLGDDTEGAEVAASLGDRGKLTR
jgi:hypothetical protein